MVAFLYVLPGIAAALPNNIEHTVEKFWPSHAGSQITNVYRSGHTLSPWLGLGWWALVYGRHPGDRAVRTARPGRVTRRPGASTRRRP